MNTITGAQSCIEPDCRARYHLSERVYACNKCGGLLQIEVPTPKLPAQEMKSLWASRASSLDAKDISGVWRYRELLPSIDGLSPVSLAEGNTPLYDAPQTARYAGVTQLFLKHEGCNPTGSFKDIGMTVGVTQAVNIGAKVTVCASTGNTAASLAAYSARAGLLCAVLVPIGGVSRAKLAQALDYGALVMEVDGNFDSAMGLVRELAEHDWVYLVNSINPFRVEGQKTAAFELMTQLGWSVPDHVVVPGGNMGNSAALGKGFAELYRLGFTDRIPRLSVVQAEGASPLAHFFATQASADLTRWPAFDLMQPIAAPQTLASAIRIGMPVSWKKALSYVISSGGKVISVSEEEIANAKSIIGRAGIGCEPASATSLAGTRQLASEGFISPGEITVAFLTGHTLKDSDYTLSYHNDQLTMPCHREGGVKGEKILARYANHVERINATVPQVLDRIRLRMQKISPEII